MAVRMDFSRKLTDPGLELLALEGADRNLQATVLVREDAPWFAGHFPDDPIVPGVALINVVVELLSCTVRQQLTIRHISRIKFRKIVRPGDLLAITAAPDRNNRYTFTVLNREQMVCSGLLTFQTDR